MIVVSVIVKCCGLPLCAEDGHYAKLLLFIYYGLLVCFFWCFFVVVEKLQGFAGCVYFGNKKYFMCDLHVCVCNS